MSRVGKNIYKRKDNRWEGRIKAGCRNGRTIYKSVYAKTYGEVRTKMDKAIVEMVREAPDISGNKSLSFRKASELWLESIKNKRKESSIVKYEDLLRCYLLPKLGDKEISKIEPKELDALITALGISGGKKRKGLSSTTLRQILSVTSSIRKYALKEGYAVGYSTDNIIIKKKKREIHVLSDIDRQKLVNYLKAVINNKNSSDKEILTTVGVLLSLLTGIREGELCALKWDNIDIKAKALRIESTMKRIRVSDKSSSGTKTRVIITAPKSESSKRDIPLPDHLVEILKPYYKEGAFLLTGSSNKYVEPRTLQNRFRSILRKCGISETNFHVLRHSFATAYFESNADTKSLSEILGHASVVITMDMYVHPSRSSKAANMEKVADSFWCSKIA